MKKGIIEAGRARLDAAYSRSASVREVARATHPTPRNTKAVDTSDEALKALLEQLREATDPAEIGILSSRLERLVFHKQFAQAAR